MQLYYVQIKKTKIVLNKNMKQLYCLFNDKKSAQKVWFEDLVYKKNLSVIESYTTYKPTICLLKRK